MDEIGPNNEGKAAKQVSRIDVNTFQMFKDALHDVCWSFLCPECAELESSTL